MWGEAGGGGPDRWSRRFTVGPTALHPRGFTLYRLTSYVFPKSSPEAITVVTVWKRFSDLHKLQCKVYKIHKDLHLSGTCPRFFKWSYFKRFDSEVVEERKKTTQLLLDFIATLPLLFTSADFVGFFQSSYPDPNLKNNKNQLGNIEEIRSSLLLPVDTIKPLEYQSSEEDSYSITDSNSRSMNPTITISITDSVSINSSINFKDSLSQPNLPSESNRSETDDNKEVPRSIASQSRNIKSKTKVNDIFYDDHKPCIQNVSYKSNLPDLISFENINLIEKMENDSHSNSKQEINRNSYSTIAQDITPLHNVESSLQKSISLNNTSIPFNLSSINSENHEEKKKKQEIRFSELREFKDCTNFASNYQQNSYRTISNNHISMTEELNCTIDLQENYVFEAGYLLSLGAKNEGKADYQAAFDSYKFGIEKLLIGVQGDTNEVRRHFVKEKVAKYLSHAEKIYSTYLNNDDEIVEKTSTTPLQATNMPVYRFNTSDYSQPYQSLSKYRVLNILSEQVMLVLCAETQQSFAMKVIQKSCNSVSDDDYFNRGHTENKLPNLPIDIPYMVKLKSYVETPNLVFLILQYASGGKLFDYIHNFAKSIPNTPAREVNLENVFIDLESIDKSSCSNQSYLTDSNKNADCVENNKFLEKNQKSIENSWMFHDISMSVNDLVLNSQKLLSDVDNVLTGLNGSSCKEKCNSLNDNYKSEEKSNQKNFKEKTDNILKEKHTSQFKVFKINCALPSKSIINWSAELLTAIENLHKFGIVCRTLQPKNLLLSDGGHLMLSYFVGRDLKDIILPFCETPHNNLYIAPELQQYPFWNQCGQIDENSCDFWSFGAILYELVVGVPLSSMHPSGFNSHTILYFPDDISLEAKDLLTRLLVFNPINRLGSGSRKIDEIKSHSYFKDIDWN